MQFTQSTNIYNLTKNLEILSDNLKMKVNLNDIENPVHMFIYKTYGTDKVF